MDFEVLVKKNPWWKGVERFGEDPDYTKWLEARLRWTPSLVDELSLQPPALHFIFGPRQVGKTTAVKLLLKRELGNRRPESVFYFRCDEVSDHKELSDIIAAYLDFRKRCNIASSLIVLDEITFPDGWWRAIKSRLDDGDFLRDVLILTGSASIEVKKQADYFPGRRGNGRDFTLWPLSFREFVKIMKPSLAAKLSGKAQENIVFLSELNALLEDYFACGGFPLAVNSFAETGAVKDDVKKAYLAWVKNDLTKTGKDERTCREIIRVLLRKIPSPVSFEGIAKETSIKSPKTIAAYLHTLEDLFVLNVANFVDASSALIQFAKNKKIHLADPLLFTIFEEWGLIDLHEKESKIAEAVLASHLFRKYGNVFYWTGKEEVDAVVPKGDRLMGFECKWRENASERKAVAGKLKEVLTLSKKDYSRRVMPLSLFLVTL